MKCRQNSKGWIKRWHSLWKPVPPQSWFGTEAFCRGKGKQQILHFSGLWEVTCNDQLHLFAKYIWKGWMTDLPVSSRMGVRGAGKRYVLPKA